MQPFVHFIHFYLLKKNPRSSIIQVIRAIYAGKTKMNT